MARSFNGSTQYLDYGSAILTTYPFTMAFWGQCDNATSYGPSMSIGDTVSLHVFGRVGFRGDIGGDPVEAVSSGSVTGSAYSTSGFSASTWTHVCGVFTSTSSRTVYMNGGNSATNTTAMTMNTPNAFKLGSDHAASAFLAGKIAEAAIWNVALTAAEAVSLAAGLSPELIRPASLVGYWPIIGRVSPELPRRGGSLTVAASAAYADHPRILYPQRKRVYFAPAASSVPYWAFSGKSARIIGGGVR